LFPVATALLLQEAQKPAGEGGMEVPSLDDFFPSPFAFEGSHFFELNRLSLVRIVATVVIVLLLWLGARSVRLVPTRGSNVFEMAVEFVHKQIAVEMLGPQAGRRYLPLLATIFFTVLGMNLTGVIPLLNIASTGLVAMPLLLAVISWIAFIVAGIKQHGAGHYFKEALFPAGAPKLVYLILTPVEFLSTFIVRPATLTIRLMANMISGHLLLTTFYLMTNYLLFSATGALKSVAVVSFAGALVFTVFEIFIAALQAYIFALLSAAYISLARESH
jgi:F-type H+-transporting ATPase subunit a